MDDENIIKWLDDYKTASGVKKMKIKNAIVVACLPLVKKIAYGLARRSSDPIDDIIQAGSIGLLKAIDSFNINSGKEFKTYASSMITGEIRHYIRDKVSMIKAPREIQELYFRINKIAMDLERESGKNPTNEQLASVLQLPLEKIARVYEAERRKQVVSLDQSVSFFDDDDQLLSDRIPDDGYLRSEEFIETKMLLKDALNKLDPVIKNIIELNYYEDLTYSEIAQRLGLSQKQVALRIKNGMDELQKAILEK